MQIVDEIQVEIKNPIKTISTLNGSEKVVRI